MFKLKENSKFSLYGIIQTISIVGLFLAVGLIVLATTGTLHMGTGLIQFVGIIAVICLCGLMSLVWARNLERGKQKIVSIVFLSIIGAVCLLWIIAICVVMGLIRKGDAATDKELVNSLRFIKIVLIISVQFICGTTIGAVITRYGKSMLVFQVIMYVSNIVVDVYVSCWMFLFKINNGEVAFATDSKLFAILTSKGMITIAVLAIVYVSLSNIIIKLVELKRQKYQIENYGDKIDKKELESQTQTNTQPVKDNKQKLVELKSMLDDGLITQEEYDEKRKKLLEDM
mgnify:FL=1